MQQETKTIADYVAIVKRRLTVVMTSFVVVLIVGVYAAYSLPATFRSTSTIAIEQQNISSDFVQTTVTTYADEQIDLVGQRVMSTASLAKIVEKFGLYPGADSVGAVEALRASTLLERLDAEVTDPRSGRRAPSTIAFNLSFEHTDPMMAQNVAQELADLYLAENVASRTGQTQLTVDFIQANIDIAKRDLDKASDALAQFKERHAGNLPDLLNFHLQSIERSEQQLDNLNGEIREAQNRRFTLETQLVTTNPLGNAVDQNGDPILGTADRLTLLQNERLRLLSIYTPMHPNVLQVEREIEMLTRGATGSAAVGANANVAALRAQLETVLTELQQARQTYTEDHPTVVRLRTSAAALQQQVDQAGTGSNASSMAALAASRDPVVQQIRQQIQTEQAYLQSLLSRRKELEDKLDESRRRVAEMPQIERDYQVLVRDSEFANTRYNEAVAQLDTARRAQSLEAGGAGDRFSLLEAPLLPMYPVKPNRKAIVLLMVLVAVGVSIGLATIVDSMDESVRGAKELAALTGAPPLAIIPFLETPVDRKHRLARNIAKSTALAGGLATAVGIAVAMG